MNIVIQHVPGAREDTFNALLKVFPTAKVVECHGHPMETFSRALMVQDAHWHLEDDVILAPDFSDRAKVLEQKGMVIRGFAMGNKSGLQPASSYLCNLCTFLPDGYGPMIAEFLSSWPRITEHPTGFDLVVRDWLVSRHERYWLEAPSLVQHAHGKSLLGPRSTYRTSATFTAHYGETTL